MCTIGAVIGETSTILLKNFDYRPFPAGWVLFESFDERLPHFALVDHNQQGLNSGLNRAGLGLQISRSRLEAPDTPEKEELRTVLNAEVLCRCETAAAARVVVEEYAAEHPGMFGGNVMLGDSAQISVTEYFGGQVRSEVVEGGCLARANHSVLGVVDNVSENSQARYEQMVAFVERLAPVVDELPGDEALARCRHLLRQPPVLNDNTRSSFVMDVRQGRVEYMVGGGPWQTFRFEATQAPAGAP